MNFTARQLNAIDIAQLGRDACVVAGPGSGKTAVLVERYFRLIEAGVEPHRILAITFTEKAAANMKTRLAGKLPGQLDKAYVSTIHAFCFRLIREHAVLAGVDPESTILDEREAVLLQKRSLNEALDGFFAGSPEEATRLMRGLSDPDLSGSLLPIFDAMRGTGSGCRPAEMPRDCPTCERIGADFRELDRRVKLTPMQRDHLAEITAWNQGLKRFEGQPHSLGLYRALGSLKFNFKRVNNAHKEILERIYKETVPELRSAIVTALTASQRQTLLRIIDEFESLYGERKREVAALDYADLEAIAIRLLEQNDEVRNRIRNQFQQVMIDEFQDTNGQQSKLLDLLRGPDAFYAVGDINQSIFSFRHSSPGIFKAYRDQVAGAGKHHVELIENWRSRADILLAVETILDQAPGIEPRPLEAARALPAKSRPSVEVVMVKGAPDNRMLEVEAEWVARKILDLRGTLPLGDAGKLADFGDMAVLVRNSEVLGTFSRVFDKNGIEHLLNRRKGFFEFREVLDLTNLLRVLSNPRDEVGTAALLRSPLVMASDEALLHLKQIDRNLGGALAHLEHSELPGMDSADLEKLRRFSGILKHLRAAQPYLSLDRLLLRAMDACGYDWEPGSRAGANIEKFLALARDSRVPLAQFVEDLAQMRESDARERDAPFDDEVNAVRMMTVHSAKGLEFPIVFLPSLHKGVAENRSQSLSFTQEFGLGICWKDLDDGVNSQGDLIFLANERETSRKEAEEANRLLYVALTRAEEHLILSYGIERKNAKNWAQAIGRVFDPLEREPDGIERIVTIAAPGERTFEASVICASAGPERVGYGRPAAASQLARILPAPEVTDQHDANISVTSLTVYADCPRRYYLARYLGWESAGVRGAQSRAQSRAAALPASELGSQVHQLLADVQLDSPDLEALRLANVFERSKLGRRAARATRIEREFGFLLAIGDVVLSGNIDLWFEERGELILVDYKTDAVDESEAQAHAQAYALQLRYYALALERVAGRLPDRAYVHLLRPDALVEIGLDAEALKEAKALVREVAEAQSTMHFPLRVAERCRRCPFYRSLCPATDPAVRLN